jgi:uncharacterized protein (TIGR00106 family)
MTPIGKGESVSQYVAKVVDVVDKSGIPYVITPMGTIIEGETWDEVMSVLKKGFDSIREKCPRISIYIKIDYREGTSGRLKSKIDSVEKRLDRRLPKSS